MAGVGALVPPLPMFLVNFICAMVSKFCTVQYNVKPAEKLYSMNKKISGMYFISFCCIGSMPGEAGVIRACHNIVTPMISGRGLTGKFSPGSTKMVSGRDKS